MSDWGTCATNLDVLETMNEESPLTNREMLIAAMQFDYTSTVDLWDDYPDHPIVKLLIDEGYLIQ